MSENAEQALAILRTTDHFSWNVVPILVLAIYVYAVEVERRNWDAVYAGLALWGMDWFNETWNSLVFHFTGYAPLWAAPGETTFLILIGLNIEICLMFLILGIVGVKLLPHDRELKILGLPNRLFMAISLSITAVVIEIFLNAAGALTWDYAWWSARLPIPIVIAGYLHFFVVAFWVHDMPSVRTKRSVVGAIYAFNAVCLILFGAVLGWI